MSWTISSSFRWPFGEGLDVAAVAEHRAGIRQRLDLVHAVRDVEEGQALVAELVEDRVDLLDVGAGEGRGRLVEDQEPRVACPAPWRSRPSAGARAAGSSPAPAGSRPRTRPGPAAPRPGAAGRGGRSGRSGAAGRRCRCCPRPRGRASARVPGRCRRSRPGWRPADRGSVTSLPARRMVPESGCTTPETILISVDLPAPFSPRMAWIEPWRQAKSTPSRARTPP